jgi:predicted metal-dependent hydrolase|tara:strand:- start:213 stop:641 length:429 start_codon:yes stop_codon:yes gene_type:complete
MILALLLLIINVYIIINTKEPNKITEIKKRYRILREHLKKENIEKFQVITRELPISYFKQLDGNIGYNTDKGNEIGLCIDGEINEIFHVLLHELAHSTVKEYSHSPEFWKNYKELREIAISIGIYREIPDKTEFCGKHVQDK